MVDGQVDKIVDGWTSLVRHKRDRQIDLKWTYSYDLLKRDKLSQVYSINEC
jgi:hypothetical protein